MIKILVPIDFSDSSRKALRYALHIGKNVEVSLCTLHVTDPPVKTGTKLVQKMQELTKEEDRLIINEKMKGFLSGMGKLNLDIKEPLIRYGEVAKQIINVSIQESFDIVIMGTKGVSKIHETLFGSNTYSTLRMSIVPTVVVPLVYDPDENKSACIALRFDKLYTQSCANLIERTKALGYDSELISVVEGKNEKIKLELNYDRKKYPLTIYDDHKPIEQISKHIKEKNVGLLALHFNVYSFFKALTTSLVSKEFTFRSTIPILFVK